MVVAVGDDQPPARIELNRMRGAELGWSGAGPADGSEELPALVEYRDVADQIGIRHICMALRHVDVAIGRVRNNVGRISQRFGGISSDARSAQRHQDLAV
jgi:hypothetical protein